MQQPATKCNRIWARDGRMPLTPYYDSNGLQIYHGDCREVLPSLPSADLVLADPPYNANR
jgi:adenine-specific DNA methylase